MIEVLTVGATTPLPDFHQRITAAFEAVMLVRCAQPGSSRGGPVPAPWSRRLDEVLVEFSRLEAAQRLLILLGRLGYPATQRVRSAGIREQHPIYQIVLATEVHREVDLLLHNGWRSGRALLVDPPGYLTPRRCRHRDHLAVAAWRAATLAAGHKRQRGGRGFYIGDGDTMTVLVRAGRVLDINVTAQRRYGCHLVQLPETGSGTLRTAAEPGRQPSSHPQNSSHNRRPSVGLS
ncbi:MAG TPA: hypothetical protein VFX61_17515 [Micromonosporaceae bacterium]|nr:hypothetical protein [Micromonosporaceae bacterium]